MGRKHEKRRKEKHHARSHEGILDITRSGMGYVMVENLHKDVLVRPSDFNRALHGDKVKVKVTRENRRNGRSEGEIEDVLERKQTDFIGHIEVNKEFAFFIPDSEKRMPDIYVPVGSLNGAKDGDRVVVRLVDWKKQDKNPNGVVVNILTAENTNDLAMKEILVQSGFPLNFEDDVIEEALRLPEFILASEIENRRDIRDILTFTIDPVDAKDFDDAISFRKLKNGNYEIGVHIADVSHFVEPGTQLDQSAFERATSVYLPDRVLPMLPEKISNELCSLRPHEDKLSFSCIFQLSAKAKIVQHWIGKTVMHSNHRFTYEEVQQIIEKNEGLYASEILILNDIAQRFRKERFRNGAINFFIAGGTL